MLNPNLRLPNDDVLQHAVSGGANREVVVVMPFSDERTIRNRCGMQKNGYNMDMGNASCDQEPNVWIAKLFADELQASGFHVVAEGKPDTPNALVVNGALLKLFVEPVLGWWSGSLEADLQVRLVVTTDSGLHAERTFFAKGVKHVMGFVTPLFEAALLNGSQDIIDQMVRAIVELADQYPQLGALKTPWIFFQNSEHSEV